MTVAQQEAGKLLAGLTKRPHTHAIIDRGAGKPRDHSDEQTNRFDCKRQPMAAAICECVERGFGYVAMRQGSRASILLIG